MQLVFIFVYIWSGRPKGRRFHPSWDALIPFVCSSRKVSVDKSSHACISLTASAILHANVVDSAGLRSPQDETSHVAPRSISTTPPHPPTSPLRKGVAINVPVKLPTPTTGKRTTEGHASPSSLLLRLRLSMRAAAHRLIKLTKSCDQPAEGRVVSTTVVCVRALLYLLGGQSIDAVTAAAAEE